MEEEEGGELKRVRTKERDRGEVTRRGQDIRSWGSASLVSSCVREQGRTLHTRARKQETFSPFWEDGILALFRLVRSGFIIRSIYFV